MTVTVLHGDCLGILPTLSGLDSVVCDPPYHLTSIVDRFGAENAAPAQFGKDGAYARASRGFMGKQWDGGDVALRPETWRLVLDALKPGAHLMAFGGTRTFARMFCAIEDAGFSYRDTLSWNYGSGFPKSHNLDGEWKGWGSGLKPAWEPIGLFRKPLSEKTVAANVLRYGTGAINIDACRVPGVKPLMAAIDSDARNNPILHTRSATGTGEMTTEGRWPANVAHDGSAEVEAAFAAFGESKSSDRPRNNGEFKSVAKGRKAPHTTYGHSDSGSASRFFMSCPYTEEEWNASINASDAGQTIDLQSALAVSALSDAVAQSMQPFALLRQSYQGRSMSVTASEFATICASATALILNIAQRFSQEWPQGKLTLVNGLVICVAQKTRTDITTITISLWKSDGCAELATFGITHRSAEHGGVASEARFIYSGKADADDRAWSKHPTVKPILLMRWLVRLITPPGGTVLDCFAGSGTTGEAARLEGFNAVLIEREAEYVADIRRRLGRASGDDTPLFSGTA